MLAITLILNSPIIEKLRAIFAIPTQTNAAIIDSTL
jgi:hypothetical protein